MTLMTSVMTSRNPPHGKFQTSISLDTCLLDFFLVVNSSATKWQISIARSTYCCISGPHFEVEVERIVFKLLLQIPTIKNSTNTATPTKMYVFLDHFCVFLLCCGLWTSQT